MSDLLFNFNFKGLPQSNFHHFERLPERLNYAKIPLNFYHMPKCFGNKGRKCLAFKQMERRKKEACEAASSLFSYSVSILQRLEVREMLQTFIPLHLRHTKSLNDHCLLTSNSFYYIKIKGFLF